MAIADRSLSPFLALAVIVSAVGCANPAASVATVEPPQTAAPTESAAIAPVRDPDSEEARQFRVRYGLRADETWIRAVAADPVAQQGVTDFGVPLMPFERMDLDGRRTDVDLLRQVNDYGSLFPDSFAGAYVDQRAAQAFVASFKDDAARHRTALTNLLPADARVDVRDVEWSTVDLQRFVKAVEAEQAWFETIGVQYLTAYRGITDDFVSVDYFGPSGAAQTIEDHFGNPTWLVADRQGPLPWAGPRGNLVVVVTDQNGKPVPGLWCAFAPEDPELAEGGEDIFGTDKTGRCLIPNLPAVPYRVTLERFVANDHYEPVKDIRVVLAPGGTTTSVVVKVP